jgi:hypothetical protein
MFKKRADTDVMSNNNELGGFNPSKTFGPKARMMFIG